MSTAEYLFVYGTLRRGAGHAMHEMLARYAEFSGVGACSGRLYDLGAYPGAVRSDNPGDFVYGELYRLLNAAAALQSLDQYEGSDGTPGALYRREQVRVTGVGGGPKTAWWYVYNRPLGDARRILSGDWLKRGAGA